MVEFSKVEKMSDVNDPSAVIRIQDRFSKVLWDQVRPWAYLEEQGLEVRTFDGNLLKVTEVTHDGAEEVFWNGRYIEPFLEQICSTEISMTMARSQQTGRNAKRALSSTRTELIDGIIRTYWTMADIHRQVWRYPRWPRKDTTDQVSRMVAFIDALISKTLKKR